MSNTENATEVIGGLDIGVPTPKSPLQKFRQWLSEKEDRSHAYTRQSENKKFARGKDVDRFFVENYDVFSTVLITYCVNTGAQETVAQQSERFFPRSVVRKCRRILNKLGVSEEYAGVRVLAPKGPDTRVPGPIPPTHAHTFLWVPGEVSEEDFRPLIEKHIGKVAGATAEAHRDGAVSVEVHHSEEVQTPHRVKSRGSGDDRERGATTALPQELGRNLPLLQCKFDARGAPEYVERWCAHLRLGQGGDLATRGVSRFRPFGRFNDIADKMHTTRKVRTARSSAETLAEKIDAEENGRVPGANPPTLSLCEDEQAFVEQYVEIVGDPSKERIIRNLERNRGRFDCPDRTLRIEEIIRRIQYKLSYS